MILVTGGCGFIGSAFVLQWLRDAGEPVVNLDLMTYAGHPGNLAEVSGEPRYHFVRGDIGDAAQVRALLSAHRPRAIVHFAAESHVDRSISGPLAFAHTNVVGTLQLLAETLAYWQGLDAGAAAAFRFLHVSTDEVFGSLAADAPAFTESHRYEPNSPYSASKAASDHFVRAYHHTFGLPTLTTNCSNNYGPRQFPEKLIPLVIHQALQGKPLPVYGDGQQVRDWLHVDDHCRALRQVLDQGRPGQSYNIGGRSECTNLSVVHAICRTLDGLRPRPGGEPYAALISHVTDRLGHDRRYAIDDSKIASELGWQPTIRFDEGIAQTVAWYLEHPDWVDAITSGRYRQPAIQRQGAAAEVAASAEA
jgi:dTDP-glucose 4,6-dehydratase